MLTALLIFAATLGLVIWQPRGLGIGWGAMLGAALHGHFVRKQPNGRGGRMAVADECVCRHDRSLSPTSPPEGRPLLNPLPQAGEEANVKGAYSGLSDEVSLREAPLKAVIPVLLAALLGLAAWLMMLR